MPFRLKKFTFDHSPTVVDFIAIIFVFSPGNLCTAMHIKDDIAQIPGSLMAFVNVELNNLSRVTHTLRYTHVSIFAAQAQ
jgi:hypothetical protein